jgi:membrane fusion protein (multidrug efflux system)
MSAVDSSDGISAFDGPRAKAGITRARLRQVLMIGGVLAVLGGSAYVYLTGGRYIGSDDSYIHSNKLMVSTDVSGLIKTVNVHEGQQVKAGDILFTLDAQPFQIALDNANAALAQTVLDVKSDEAAYRSATAQIAAQQAQVNMTKQTYDRYAALAGQNAIAATTVDQARGAMLTAEATLTSLQQAAATDLAKLNGNPNLPPQLAPEYLKAKAMVDEDRRQLDHATVRAPFDGVVGEVDSLQPGTLVISAMSAFTTTSAVGLIGNAIWIESDMKETDLTYVHPGDPVDITIDTYPGHRWTGHIDNVSAGSDSAFSALPSENASGNWVKVVQRIPVRIAVDQKAGDPPLRSGMSAVISIDTGKTRLQRLRDEWGAGRG